MLVSLADGGSLLSSRTVTFFWRPGGDLRWSLRQSFLKRSVLRSMRPLISWAIPGAPRPSFFNTFRTFSLGHARQFDLQDFWFLRWVNLLRERIQKNTR